MKKLLFAAIAIFFAVNANAQFGVVAGVTSTETNYKDAVAKANDINQFHVGLTVTVPLPLLRFIF